MNTLYSLTKRNIFLYLKSKSAVLFSLLAALITLVLFIVFLGEMYISQLVENGISNNDAVTFVFGWVIGGIIVMNSMTIPQVVLGQIVIDKENRILGDFYVAPINRNKLAGSYIIAALVCATVINFFIFLVAELILYLKTAAVFSLTANITMFFYIMLFTVVFSTVLFSIYLFINNSNALGGISAFISSVGGFLAGIYVNVGIMGESVRTVLSINPIAHAASLSRKILTLNQIDKMFKGVPIDIVNDFKADMGIVLYVKNFEFTNSLMFLSLAFTFSIFLIFSLFKLKKDKL